MLKVKYARVVCHGFDCRPDFASARIILQKYYDFETLGIPAPYCNCSSISKSREYKRAIELMGSSCVKGESRYTIDLPWKKDPALLPDNYPLALRRLESLERSFLRNLMKAEMYSSVISDYEKNEWSCKVTGIKVTGIKPVHYLLHHGVYKPEKISTPLRVVFDPATPYLGASLNSFLHKDPGLIGNLLGVLLRFREDTITFAGDIAKMYLQICILEGDTHLHRHRDLDITRDPTVYRLLRVSFGAKPSPDMASYVMLKIAEEHESSQPDVASILREDRYMDDLIHCFSTEDIEQEPRADFYVNGAKTFDPFDGCNQL